MKTAKMVLISLLLIGLVAVVGANEREKEMHLHGPTVHVPMAEGSRAPGDDCSEPIVIPGIPFFGTGLTNCGSGNNYSDMTCLWYYDGGEDIMFTFTLDAPADIEIIMDPLGTTWTGIGLDTVCPPGPNCIYDRGTSGIRTIQASLDAGTYYLMVDTWPAPTCIPSFNLTIQEYVPPPPFSICDLMQEPINETGTFTGDTCDGENLSPNFFDGYAAGFEHYYEVFMPAGSQFTVELWYDDPDDDGVIWLLGTCEEPIEVIARVDDYWDPSYPPGNYETVTYMNTTGQDKVIYLVIDSYYVDMCGPYSFTFVQDAGEPVATRVESLSSVKSLFR